MTLDQSVFCLESLSYLHFCRVKFADDNILAVESVNNILHRNNFEFGIKILWENMPKPKFFFNNFPELTENYKIVSNLDK